MGAYDNGIVVMLKKKKKGKKAWEEMVFCVPKTTNELKSIFGR